ncbi:MAG TPA: tetratricopeptide repeat protein, partial [Rhodanobacteraceae bacterium]
MNPAPSSKVAADLQSASALLRTGKHATARDLLRDALSAQPGLTEARWLLAVCLFETGNLADAQRELQTVIEQEPHRAPAYAMSGRIFLSSGEIDSAIPMFRHALDLSPDPALAATLARALLMQARAQQAAEVLAPFVQTGKVSRELLLLYGHALMTLGRAEEAALAFDALVRLSPGDGEAKVRLAAALSDSGRHVEAEERVREGIAQGVATPEAYFVLGRSLMGQSKLVEAEPALRRVIRSRPDHVTAQANLSELIWMRSGDVADASREIDAALRLHPRLSQLRIAKANLLASAGKHEEALQLMEEGMASKVAPSQLLQLHVAAAQIAIETDATRAIHHARSALELDPGHWLALSAYGDALLAQGHANQAIKVATRMLESAPYDGRAIALLASAARMAGDARHRELFDYEDLVLTQLLDTPPGWTTLAGYLSDLAEALQRLHSANAHPVGQSLRQGSQVELDLERAPEPAIRSFASAIEGPIHRYMAHVGTGS